MRIFLDANILFSAADPKSPTSKLLRAAASLREILTNQHAWEEARRNLQLKRPQYETQFESLKKLVPISSAHVPMPNIDLPQSDLPVWEGAVGAQCTHLWTSDKRHFGKWYGKQIGGIEVLSSLLLAKMLIREGWQP